jgi:hypothetical protein
MKEINTIQSYYQGIDIVKESKIKVEGSSTNLDFNRGVDYD